MEREFIFSEYKSETFHLRPDGLIGLGGTIIPQTCALLNANIAGSIVNKEPGEGGALTIAILQGKLEARFVRGQWRVRTDIPALLEEFQKLPAPPESLLPSAPSGRPGDVPFPMPEPYPAARPPSPYGMIATLAVLAVIAVGGYYTFEEPINRVADARAARMEARAKETEIRLREAKQKEEYRELEKNVRTAHAAAVESITAVAQASRALADDVLASTKVSLANVTDNPNATPREIDQLLRKDVAFLGAWNQVLNAFVSERRLDEYRGQLQTIDAHDKAGALREADRSAAERLAGALHLSRKSIADAKDNLAIVAEKLASKRLQEKMAQEKRSSP